MISFVLALMLSISFTIGGIVYAIEYGFGDFFALILFFAAGFCAFFAVLFYLTSIGKGSWFDAICVATIADDTINAIRPA